ncbi:ligase-associated DNA damage response endonuclease PdeM [Henriciella marina]|uniref:ligase-associated DNA damage response endonuclease PdeM n=1 Tax=Henriciella marina TaxID=453851 RepID=UPI0003768BF0|nr:ligase-associated DNA damage response endonuclease PdeM [Henriciella marina]
MSAPLRNTGYTVQLHLRGELFTPLAQGALWWAAERTLVVSDLHLEKGSSYARRGQLLPPYDTSATLKLVEALVAEFAPDCVISLGDSFHDPLAEARLSPAERVRIRALTAQTDWVWVEGNHDPDPPAHLGGRGVKVLRKGPCVFRHEPTGEAGELSGHLHPVARVRGRGRSLRRKCFVTDGHRLIMPSMGTFTGGLNILDDAVSRHFTGGLMVFAAGDAHVHMVDRRLLTHDIANTQRGGHWRL